MKKNIVFIMLVLILAFSAVEVYGQNDPRQLLNAGALAYNDEEYEEAIYWFEKAIKLKSDYDDAYWGRGRAYSALGKYDNAIADFNRAIQINPRNAGYYASRGAAYQYKKDNTLAIADANAALKIDPNNRLAKAILSDLNASSANTQQQQPANADFQMNGTTLIKYKGKADNVTIPNGVTIIGDRAFVDSEITSVTIPASVINIGKSVFDNCFKLKSITVVAQNNTFSSIDGVLFNKDKNVLIKFPPYKQYGNYTIPSSVTTIGDEAFIQSSFESITIPSSVLSIGKRAFHGCNYITSVTIPSSVTSIGDMAFEGLRSLKSVTLQSNFTYFGNSAFENCFYLTNVTLLPGLTKIGDRAFQSCESIKNVTIPSSVSSIGILAFDGCDGLTNITLSRRSAIGDKAFPPSAKITYSD